MGLPWFRLCTSRAEILRRLHLIPLFYTSAARRQSDCLHLLILRRDTIAPAPWAVRLKLDILQNTPLTSDISPCQTLFSSRPRQMCGVVPKRQQSKDQGKPISTSEGTPGGLRNLVDGLCTKNRVFNHLCCL